MSSEEAKELIQRAFADTPHPGNGREDLAVEIYDDEGTTEHFRFTKWEDHSVEQLRQHCSSLGFFTGPAFRYFLPAYMIAELDDPKSADVIGESIEYFLTEKPSHKKKRLAVSERGELFNQDERLAIAAFLEVMFDRYPSQRTMSTLEAWNQWRDAE
ncbi:DUF6714 family protein [Aeoliella sp.]|uniref:DUF6714 family protein n=1 Tax=Aeoliella sp. TaxID=2795800 RepID=UPI003CCB94C7